MADLGEMTINELTRSSLMGLANQELGAIRIRRFLPMNLIRTFAALLKSGVLFEEYNPDRYYPPSSHFGPVINEHRAAFDESYWRDVDKVQSFWRRLAGRADVRSSCRRGLAAAWNGPVRPASVDGRDLFWGMLRETTHGTLPHWDDVTRESLGTRFDVLPEAQLAFNLFLSVPEEGGETCVWERPWQETDEHFRRGYGYSRDVLEEERPLVVRPDVGDAVLFDSRKYHAVRDHSGGRRVALSFFVGIVDRNQLILWS